MRWSTSSKHRLTWLPHVDIKEDVLVVDQRSIIHFDQLIPDIVFPGDLNAPFPVSLYLHYLCCVVRSKELLRIVQKNPLFVFSIIQPLAYRL